MSLGPSEYVWCLEKKSALQLESHHGKEQSKAPSLPGQALFSLNVPLEQIQSKGRAQGHAVWSP